MAENQLILGLKRRYARTLGALAKADLFADRGRLWDDEAHLAYVIRMFAPHTDLAAIKPRGTHRRPRFRTSDTLTILREEGRPMTMRAISKRLLAARGVRLTERELNRTDAMLNAAMLKLAARGVVQWEGKPRMWSVAP
jgi:hypothetical protein